MSPDARCHQPLWGHRHGLSPGHRAQARLRRRTGPHRGTRRCGARRPHRTHRSGRPLPESAALALVPAVPAARPARRRRDAACCSSNPSGCSPTAGRPSWAGPRQPSPSRWRTGCAPSRSSPARCSTWRRAPSSAPSWGWAPLSTGTVLGAGLAFGLGRILGQDALRPLLRARWLKAADGQLSRHGFRSMLAARLFPGVPFWAANYCAAVSRMGWLPVPARHGPRLDPEHRRVRRRRAPAPRHRPHRPSSSLWPSSRSRRWWARWWPGASASTCAATAGPPRGSSPARRHGRTAAPSRPARRCGRRRPLPSPWPLSGRYAAPRHVVITAPGGSACPSLLTTISAWTT